MLNPSPQKEQEMETVDTLFGRSLEVHHQHHSHSLNKDCIQVCKRHKLPAISPLTALSSCTHTHTHKHTRSIHRSTQCLTFSLNISYDLKICEERAVTALSFSFFISSLYFDSAWIRMSLYEQTASVLFQVQGLSWEQMKVTHCFQMLMKFPLRMNWIFGPLASENVFIYFQGGGNSVLTFYHVLQGYSWHSLNWWFLLKFYIPCDLNQWGILLLEIHNDGEEFKHWHSFEWVKICPVATLSFHLNLFTLFTSMPF